MSDFFFVNYLRLQQCHLPEETAGKGLDNRLQALVSFSLLKGGPAGGKTHTHTHNTNVFCITLQQSDKFPNDTPELT